jgi:hypothetical protein
MKFFENDSKDEPDFYILDPQGRIKKEHLEEIILLARLTLPDQLVGEIELNSEWIEKEKIPPLVVKHPGGLLDYELWGHLRLKEFPEGFFE